MKTCCGVWSKAWPTRWRNTLAKATGWVQDEARRAHRHCCLLFVWCWHEVNGPLTDVHLPDCNSADKWDKMNLSSCDPAADIDWNQQGQIIKFPLKWKQGRTVIHDDETLFSPLPVEGKAPTNQHLWENWGGSRVGIWFIPLPTTRGCLILAAWAVVWLRSGFGQPVCSSMFFTI